MIGGTFFGSCAVALDRFDLDEWQELMRYLYLPVRMPGSDVRLPDRLAFARPLVAVALDDAPHEDPYTYLSVHRGFATPDNPLNRPGWHCDGFGTTDRNYTWCDRWSTRFAEQPFNDISADHLESMRQFEAQVDVARAVELPCRWLYRLTPWVVHTTPIVPAGGGMRSFLKISVSDHRYNLIGNSRNYLFDYDWKMWPRDVMRNDPARSMADFYESEDE